MKAKRTNVFVCRRQELTLQISLYPFWHPKEFFQILRASASPANTPTPARSLSACRRLRPCVSSSPAYAHRIAQNHYRQLDKLKCFVTQSHCEMPHSQRSRSEPCLARCASCPFPTPSFWMDPWAARRWSLCCCRSKKEQPHDKQRGL